MQKEGILYQSVVSIFGKRNYKRLGGNFSAENLLLARKIVKLCDTNARISCKLRYVHLDLRTPSYTLRPLECNSVANDDTEDLSEEDDELCPVECVKEFQTDEEFRKILEKAKFTNTLVVVDFYRTSCGSCKYIEQGFAKLCRGSGEEEAPVIFLKHNVLDEYDEQSEVAERLRIRTVPLFHFYKDGVLLEAFPTRDKERILSAILKYTAPTTGDA